MKIYWNDGIYIKYKINSELNPEVVDIPINI